MDEVTLIDTSSWICIHVYIIEGMCRVPYLLNAVKCDKGKKAINIFEKICNSLHGVGGLTSEHIIKKLICITTDGASVMQGELNGVCHLVKTKISPCCTQMACMSHRMNLATKRITDTHIIKEIELLVKDVHSYFT